MRTFLIIIQLRLTLRSKTSGRIHYRRMLMPNVWVIKSLPKSPEAGIGLETSVQKPDSNTDAIKQFNNLEHRIPALR